MILAMLWYSTFSIMYDTPYPVFFFFFSSRRRHTRYWRDWSSDVCSSDLYPEGYDLPDWVIEKAKKNALENGGTFKITHDMEEAYRGADVVIPKNWGSWVTNESNEVVDDLLESYKGWKCTEEMMALTNKNSIYIDRKSTRLNSSHANISYAVFCL